VGGDRKSAMTYEVEVKEAPEMLVASIRRHASWATMGKEIREGLSLLAGFVTPVGFGDGMPGVITHAMPSEGSDGRMDVEIVMPIRKRVQPPEGIEVRLLPAATMASTIHRGPYHQIKPAYEALVAWITDHGRSIAGPPRELYLNDPGEVGEGESLTEIQFPIR
jgi:effector-binding domain-containing protein